jgi:TRAP-type C4-dicarboxylate transport system substrate-binding protein
VTSRLRQLRLIARVSFLACGSLASASGAAQVLLNVNSWLPSSHPLTATMMAWCAAVENAVAGRVKCSLLPKPALRASQTFDAVRDGLVDLAVAADRFTPGRFPLSGIAELPLLGDSAEAISIAYQRTYQRALAKADEHKGVVVLAVFTHGPAEIYDTRLPVASLRDLESLRYLAVDRFVADVARTIGANPLRAAPSGFSALLSSGFADGAFLPKEAALSLKLIPHIRHATHVPGGLYNTSFVFIMNPRKWSRISKPDQDAIMALSGEAYARSAGRAWDAADAQAEAAMREAKIRIAAASPAFVAEIKARTAGLEKAWIDAARAKGIDGEATLNAFRAEISALSTK